MKIDFNFRSQGNKMGEISKVMSKIAKNCKTVEVYQLIKINVK